MRLQKVGGLCGVALLLWTGTASAELLGIYEFTGQPTGNNQFNAVTSQPPAGTFSTFTRHGMLQFLRGDNIFSSGSWNRIHPTIGAGYTSFSFESNDPFEVTLDSLSFNFGRNQWGPSSGFIQMSTDGFQTAQTVSFFDVSQDMALGGDLEYLHAGQWGGNVVWDFNDLAIDPGQTVEFRFFGQGAQLNKGTLWFDNVALFHSQVPIPGSLALCGLGLFLIGFVRRKVA